MEILEISYVNFRNLEDKNLKFVPGINLFTGKNGQGKTSILEGLYFAATGKSFRTSKNGELIKYNREKMGVFVSYRDSISEKTLTVKIDASRKEYRFNGKKSPYDEFYGKLNVVSFIPEDINLIMGTPSVRRNFFDSEISQANFDYFQDLKKYSKVLKIRNRFLKEKNYKDPMFNIYEDEFIKLGARIIKKRLEYVKNISIILNLNYRKLFDNKKELSLKYSSELGEMKNLDLKGIEERIGSSIKDKFSQELRYGFSLTGPQKDDFLFLLNEKEAKSFSSQGEKKSIIFSLKLSEIDMIMKEKRERPIFIIDDISSYFDSIRKDSILNYLTKREIQVFISSTGLLDIVSRNFVIEKGEVKEDDNEH